MWELIQSNKRKSVILVALMAVCLLTLGHVIGLLIDPVQGGWAGLLAALVVWAVMSLISYYSGDSILLAVSNAKEVTSDVHPQLFNVVEEIKIAANFPSMPRVYIINETAPNAFATGVNPEKSSVAVTAGLLSKLNRDELQGVIAHEMSHILNRDVLFMTLSGVMLGSITLLTEIFTRSFRYTYSGDSSRRFRSGSLKVGGGAQVFIYLAAFLFIILAPILAQLLYFSLSRKREYLADASGVRLTRYPEGLASALEKISSSDSELYSANDVTAAMFIVNPLHQERKFTSLLSTHPPIQDRVKILRNMSQGVGFMNYETAFQAVKGKSASVIPPLSLHDEKTIPIRTPHPDSQKKTEPERKEVVRDVADLMRAVNGFAFLTCTCGIKFKVPSDFNRSEIICPRCGHITQVPLVILAGAAQALDQTAQTKTAPAVTAEEPQIYHRKGTGWESFPCSCGNKLLQISPEFCGSYITCRICGRKTLIQ